MWKTLSKFVSSTLQPEAVLHQQYRTTYILKRRYPPLLHKKGAVPKRLRSKHYIYDLVKDTSVERQPDIDVILTKYVEGVGKLGERVTVRPLFAYNKLLLPGLAVYATPEMLDKYEKYTEVKDAEEHSSPTAQRTVNLLSNLTLAVTMNKDNPWTLKPWHLRNCFRRCGFHVPEEAIQLPSKEIKGPNMDYQGKEFYVTVTINNMEKVKVRCILHHWATDVLERLPHDHDSFKRRNEPIFAEDKEVLASLPSVRKIPNATV